MKQLTSRQVNILFFILVLSTKLLVLPSLIAGSAKNSGWIVVLFMFLVDSMLILIMFSVMKTFPNIKLKDFFEKAFGKIMSKIILFLLGVFLIFKVAMMVRECYEFYNETVYVDFSWFKFLLPVGLIITYFSIKPLRGLGRASEILIYFVLTAIFMAFLFSIPSADFLSFFPLMPNGIKPIFSSMFDYAFWFGDFLVLLFFMGDVKYEKKSFKNLYLSYAYAMVIVLAITFLLYALFGSIAPTYKTAIVDITEYVPRLSTSGRFTWIIIFLWPIALIYSMGIFQAFSTTCFACCFNIKKNDEKYVAICSVCLTLGVLITAGFSQTELILYVTSAVKYFVLVIQYIVPIFFPLGLINIIKKEKKHEKFVEK